MWKNQFRVCFCLLICVLKTQCQLEEGDRCISQKDGLNGTCVSSRRCLSVVYDIKTKKNPQICSFNGQDPIVCCTDCELVNDTRNVLVDKNGYNYFKTGQKATDRCIQHMVHLNYSCDIRQGLRRVLAQNQACYEYGMPVGFGAIGGVDAERGDYPHMCLENTVNLNYPCPLMSGVQRTLEYVEKKCYVYMRPFVAAAVGGRDAIRGQYPHMALLGYGDELESAQWLCGGSVISDRYILTAAHCISSAALGPVKFVALGILKRTDPPATWQRYTIKRVIPHPQYKAPSKYHDIALLEVEKKITFSSQVLPACLNTDDSSVRYATATGWGALGHNMQLADTLQVVNLQEFRTEECTAAYPPHRLLLNGYDHATQSCYGDKQQVIDTCEGDSGGPLQVSSEYGNCIFKIIGVTSYGRACGFAGNAGMYTRVSHYVPWIESLVWP